MNALPDFGHGAQVADLDAEGLSFGFGSSAGPHYSSVHSI
jgi:hypothetical protein